MILWKTLMESAATGFLGRGQGQATHFISKCALPGARWCYIVAHKNGECTGKGITCSIFPLPQIHAPDSFFTDLSSRLGSLLTLALECKLEEKQNEFKANHGRQGKSWTSISHLPVLHWTPALFCFAEEKWHPGFEDRTVFSYFGRPLENSSSFPFYIGILILCERCNTMQPLLIHWEKL